MHKEVCNEIEECINDWEDDLAEQLDMRLSDAFDNQDEEPAVVRAVDECIAKGILEEVLIKNRAEVIDMFLTTFDRKMYEEAMREEGRDEVKRNWLGFIPYRLF